MINKRSDQISIDDFKELITYEISESRTLEYKSELHIASGDERKEFLADVSSFANSIGGDLIFGIREDENHHPTELCGIECEDTDELIRQIDSLIRDSISPRISGIEIKTFLVLKNHFILLIRIAKSYLSPHRVTYKGYDKFFSRNSGGKFPMDVNDLRVAFNMTQNITEKASSFISDRINFLLDNSYSIFENNQALFLMHLIPLSSFDYNNIRTISEIKNTVANSRCTTFGTYTQPICNIDGVIQSIKGSHKNSSYTEYYKNGIVETVTSRFFNPSFEAPCFPPLELKIIYKQDIVAYTIQSLKEYIEYFKLLDCPTPLLLSVSLINVMDYTICNQFYDAPSKIDRNILHISEVIIDSYDEKAESILRPVFDSIWNSCGYDACSAYDKQGKYIWK